MDSIQKLKNLFAQFPTIGQRTAERFVFYLIHQPKESIDDLLAAIQELKKTVRLCRFCFNPHQGSHDLCHICHDASRNQQLLCVVEKEQDLQSIENTKKYHGRYFILGGTLTLRDANGDHLRTELLKDRVQKGNFSEIIIALNPTPEGKSTSVLVERALKEIMGFKIQDLRFKITHLAQGLPVGGELEYADEETLESAFEGRK